MSFEPDITQIISDFYQINEKIKNISASLSQKKKKEHFWELKRLHWKKNRLIFNNFYQNISLSKIFINNLFESIKIDLTLFNFWKKSSFRNLCSKEVITIHLNEIKKKSICRISFQKRDFCALFLIQAQSGCICCTSDEFLKSPIWWDEFDFLFFLYKNISDKKICKISFQINNEEIKYWKNFYFCSKNFFVLIENFLNYIKKKDFKFFFKISPHRFYLVQNTIFQRNVIFKWSIFFF
mmetsp:Transcript_45131/g.113115  ORF Transcript_45131/g.113115 Transcript_45131/m.113115 type:complete len:238 (+) Transcript_45131:2590-3303(+)